jgi:hypothetical protein
LAKLSTPLAAVLVPLVIAGVGHWYTTAIERDTSARAWTELVLDILRDPNSSGELRSWAIDVVEAQGVLPFPEGLKKALKKGDTVLPQPSAVQAPILDRVSTAANVAKMDKLQTRRISALLNQNLTEALAAYDEAYALWPIFRNVDEIRTGTLGCFRGTKWAGLACALWQDKSHGPAGRSG